MTKNNYIEEAEKLCVHKDCVEMCENIALVTQAHEHGRQEGVGEAITIVKAWKNEGEHPTEADLVLENVLQALHSKKQ